MKSVFYGRVFTEEFFLSYYYRYKRDMVLDEYSLDDDSGVVNSVKVFKEFKKIAESEKVTRELFVGDFIKIEDKEHRILKVVYELNGDFTYYVDYEEYIKDEESKLDAERKFEIRSKFLKDRDEIKKFG